MIKFVNKKTGELKNAFSVKENDEKMLIKFSEDGKEYAYNKDNIEVINEENNTQIRDISKLPFRIYTFKKQCYKCHRNTDIITYIKFSDGKNEDITYPWDKKRLIKTQSFQHLLAHMQDPSIEYYTIMIVGDCKKYDDILMEKFPNKVSVQYSATTKTSYPMNICSHCGAQQGYYYVYRQINELIKSMQKIDIIE